MAPATSEAATSNHPTKDVASAEDQEVDLFDSDEEGNDPEVAKAREERLRKYKERKAGKSKPAAKTAVTLDVKPWGTIPACNHHT